MINKFFQIRQNSLETFEDESWDDKCSCLLSDPVEMWSFNNNEETSTSKYIVSFSTLSSIFFPLFRDT